MSETSKCPHCGLPINKIKANQMNAEYLVHGMHTSDKRNCWVFSCPMPACGKIISIQHDPISQRNEMATAIAQLVAKELRASR